MSLICGIVSRKDPALAGAQYLEAILDASQHRCRDGRLTFVDPDAGVALGYGHSATFGQDPSVPSWHADEECVAAVDGDVYEPSRHLEEEAATQYRSSHAGAVLADFRRDPDSFPEQLDGFFSSFVWDRQKRVLHLSSDRLGHRLVYFFHDEALGLLIFSSELKGILAHPAVERRLEKDVLPQYLAFGLIHAPATLVPGVRKLGGAEHIVFASQGERSQRYWRPSPISGDEEQNDLRRSYRGQFVSAVTRTLAGAEDVAVFLSGGVDSSSVLAAMKVAGVKSLRSFTLAYAGHRGEYDIGWAERVAAKLGSEHRLVFVEPEKDITPEIMSGLFGQLDEPFDSASRLASEHFLIAAALDGGVKSALTGATPGGTNTLNSLKKFDADFETRTAPDILRSSIRRKILMKERRIAAALAYPAAIERLQTVPLANLELVHDLDPISVSTVDGRLRAAADKDSLFYQTAAPRYGFEERTPFLDSEFARLSVSLSREIWSSGEAADGKAVLRTAFEEELRLDFRSREKRPYPGAPLPGWMRAMLIPTVELLVDRGIVAADYAGQLADELEQDRKRARREVWRWFLLGCWYQINVEQTDPFARAG